MRGYLLVLSLLFAGCQSLKPEDISLPDYPDLAEVYIDQYQSLGSRTLEKKVTLDSEQETNAFQMDSAAWKEELEFLIEISPKKPEYVGVYKTIEDNEGGVELQLIEGEKSTLKQLSVGYYEGAYNSIAATIHEDKDVYVHHREINISFREGLISSWSIEGYQKMMFKDTVRFGIVGQILD